VNRIRALLSPVAAFRFAAALLAMALAGAPCAAAQPAARVPRVALLAERSPPDRMAAAFVDALRALGYVEGRNVVVDIRYGGGDLDRYPALATELARAGADVIVVGGSVAAAAARAASSTVPIVFTSVSDPVAMGLVASLARPGGNLTGISNIVADLAGKQLELLHLARPGMTRVAVLHNPRNSTPALDATRKAALALSLTILPLPIRNAGDIAPAFVRAANARADAVLALSDPVLGNATAEMAARAIAHRMPAIYARSEFVDQGGLMAYGPDFAESYRRAATYVDRILKGTPPGELAVEQPTTFELVVNLRTARELGLKLPPALLQRATRVIE